METEIDIPAVIVIALGYETEYINKFTPFIDKAYNIR